MNKVTHLGLLIAAGGVGAKIGSTFWGWAVGLGLLLALGGWAWDEYHAALGAFVANHL